jgi:hypothetical protein
VVKYTDLKADELSWFANNFMLDFAKISIAVENFSNEPYDCFYEGFWNIFKEFLSQRKTFDFNKTLYESYTHFFQIINDFIPTDSKDDFILPLEIMSDSGDVCISKLNELRALEER